MEPEREPLPRVRLDGADEQAHTEAGGPEPHRRRDAAEDERGYTVRFIHAGKLYRYEARQLGDWYDIPSTLTAVNRSLADAGVKQRFLALRSEGQDTQLIFADPAAFAPLAADLGVELDTTGDTAMTAGAGWPMGPCTLVDLVGIDVHVHASEALYAKLREPRMAPPPRIVAMRNAGLLGRKSGRGFYEYSADRTR